jgi:hypothetical protein
MPYVAEELVPPTTIVMAPVPNALDVSYMVPLSQSSEALIAKDDLSIAKVGVQIQVPEVMQAA